jgi:DNA-binding transcriptional regulator YiaG
MRYLFDRESNSLAVTFADGRQYRDSVEISDGVVVDFDVEGKPFSIEFLHADRFVDVTGLVSGRPVRLSVKTIADDDEVDAVALRRWREDLSLSRDELAARLQISADLLEHWESGAVKIENAGILRLALQAVEGNAHEEYLREALRDVTETLQTYLKNEPAPLKAATSGRSR